MQGRRTGKRVREKADDPIANKEGTSEEECAEARQVQGFHISHWIGIGIYFILMFYFLTFRTIT